MMIERAAIVTEARGWLGTPFHHQGRLRGIGCDCGGLVGGVAVACGVVPPQWWLDFDRQFGGYGRQPANGTLRRICQSFMAPIDTWEPGDVLLLRFEAEPQHLAIVSDYRHGGLAMIHALASAGRVIEHRLAPVWTRRVVEAFRMPQVH